MRVRGKWSWGLLAAGVVAGGLVLAWPPAEAGDREIKDLQAICQSSVGQSRRAMLVEQIRAMDTAASRKALEEMASGRDDRLSVLALGAIARDGYSGADAKLKATFEATGRSDLVRSAALTAWCASKKRDGARWADVGSYVDSMVGTTNQALKDTRDALKAKIWKGE